MRHRPLVRYITIRLRLIGRANGEPLVAWGKKGRDHRRPVGSRGAPGGPRVSSTLWARDRVRTTLVVQRPSGSAEDDGPAPNRIAKAEAAIVRRTAEIALPKAVVPAGNRPNRLSGMPAALSCSDEASLPTFGSVFSIGEMLFQNTSHWSGRNGVSWRIA